MSQVNLTQLKKMRDTYEYDLANGVAIDFLRSLGLTSESVDTAGDEVGDVVQSLLTEAMLRVPGMAGTLLATAVRRSDR